MLELYRRAQVPDTAIDPSNNMPYETTRFSADKFAELIVKECCDIVRQCRFAPDEDAIVNEIVNHFGVDGMSTEDKKTLIKELLGVKNENTNY